MKIFGLIGFPLSHSFSKKYFTQKFLDENISGVEYQNFEIENVEKILEVLKSNKDVKGFNVTIPHKQAIIPLLDEINEFAKRIGAVNVVKVLPSGKLIGYNSDYFGFLNSLKSFVVEPLKGKKALILGTGGASKAVKVAFENEGVSYQYVSRNRGENILAYSDLNAALIQSVDIIVNASPLGMSPNVNSCPDIPYEALSSKHFLYDLVYNPAETLFMKKGAEKGAKTINGLEMLELQAEKAWEIWKD